MTGMNFIVKLLDGIQVEWKNLWQVTTWDKRFNAVDNRKQPKVINYQYLLAADLFKLEKDNGNVFLLSTGERTGWTTEELAGTYIRTGEIVSIPWGKSRPVRDVIKYFKGHFVTADNRIATASDTDKLLNKFLYYWLMYQSKVIDGFYRGSGIQHPSMAAVLDMPIPIPPINIQAEIVRILDAFTELTAELKAELTARKKQYNYYRNKLLSFEDGEVEWMALAEICLSISAGGDVPENYVKGQTEASEEFPYPIYSNGIGESGLYGFSDSYKIGSDAVTISARGTIGYHTVRGAKFTPIIRLITLLPNTNVISTRFLNYVLDMTPIGGTDGGIPQLTIPTVKKLSIPVPALAEQKRIVAILDKFDTLTTSISEGLPREIELRQKQYEYYRDLLLSFPKPEGVAA